MIDKEFDPIDDDRNDEGGDPSEEMAKEMREMFQQASRALHNSLANAARRERADSPLVMDRQGKTKTPFLDKYSHDLTKSATEHKLDPVVGRDSEIYRLTEILGRRKKNNPVLIGDPGVGKSAIVEGLAQQIAYGAASPVFRGKRILSLDLTSVVAGTQYRGDFEKRMKGIISELEQCPDVIVFIDEIHTLMGAGSASGTMDAANILKPALARGTVQCIGATTLDEYRKSIEKDGALERRFQKIIVNPTSAEETMRILENIKARYENHHHVIYTQEALRACVMQSQRYITDRVFPDKAIDALDEVGSRMHLRTAVISPKQQRLEAELDEVRQKKKSAVVQQNFELAAALRDRGDEIERRLLQLQSSGDDTDRADYVTVTEKDVCEVVSLISGVPVSRVSEDDSIRLRKLGEILKGTVIGQDKAVETCVRAIRRNSLGLRSHNRPIGAFMFLGPTGVGKTYLAQQLAREVFGSSDALIRVDMSEFNESFNTSRLVGAPPGYVGYDEGGQLTERVRRHPYSVVLLDEIEKAHQNIFNLLLQVLDEGRLTDGNGRLIDFRNTIVIMTSNAGTRQLKDFSRGIGFGASTSDGNINSEYARSIIEKALRKQFAPEFLNRLDEIVMFEQLSLDSIKQIIDIEMKDLYSRVSELGYKLRMSDKAKEFVAERGYDVQYGARPLKRAVQQYIEDELCNLLLDSTLQYGAIIKVGKPKASEKLVFSVSDK
ncbi:MAG: ATP-dependent Clp protease ATP-binding subunit [Bacteroidales bacterium]|nr:ATP-dependent Clp protease ATP-binding subunit [Bacteroidales bacterium]MCM1147645.1 ATP-dependent Clp protease ATP-binding subunit [Bacteroidales bacterium]MCM1206827.1 ATP-dependent Clp protease ATP-binding subunit [Bacillota bacterium]MCM1510727.1 ATP-dependent Clp protease ATP-binding subunit [Clostridium sp.]